MLFDNYERFAFCPARYTISFKDPEYTTGIHSDFYKVDLYMETDTTNMQILKC